MIERCIICYWLVDGECHKRSPVDVKAGRVGYAIWPRPRFPGDNGCGDWKMNEEISCPHCGEATSLYTVEKKMCFFCSKDWDGVSQYVDNEGLDG